MTMIVKIVRRLALEEIRERLNAFLAKHPNKTFEELEEEFFSKGGGFSSWSEYSEIRDLYYAYRGYEEGGELMYSEEQYLDLSPEELNRVLTAKRLQVLSTLARCEVSSVSELARITGRDVKNVYEDLKVLESLKFVELRKEKGRVVPRLLLQRISIDF